MFFSFEKVSNQLEEWLKKLFHVWWLKLNEWKFELNLQNLTKEKLEKYTNIIEQQKLQDKILDKWRAYFDPNKNMIWKVFSFISWNFKNIYPTN